MRSTLRITAFVFVLLMLLVPLAAYANDGPCPDDPVLSQTCTPNTPPFYVVSNRSFDRLDAEAGTGCRPWILNNPDCEDCAGGSAECLAAEQQVNDIVCAVGMPAAGAQPGDILYEMCCDCSVNADGDWVYREWVFDGTDCAANGPGPWQEGLPPDTGIDLPAPIIIGGLALIGAALLAAGLVVRRQTVKAT
jgi:hypothetical protein